MHQTIRFRAAILIGGFSMLSALAENSVPSWSPVELTFTSTRTCANPFQDVDVAVRVTCPSGRTFDVAAFWDGGQTWRARIASGEKGRHTWQTRCSVPEDTGLHAKRGTFDVVAKGGHSPILQHGPVRLSDDRRRFVRSDGEPFFWLADTAWNGALRSTDADWSRYVKKRAEQRFTAIQFVSTQWRGGWKVLDQLVFTGKEKIRVNPEAFQRLDHKVQEINSHDLVAAPVILWALNDSDPGESLSEADAIRLARYIVARWGSYDVVWILGGDGRYRNPERWRNIGRAVFGDRHDRLVTLHQCGMSWVTDRFGQETWLDFIGYQSGHGDNDQTLRWLTSGPPSKGWLEKPTRPIVNLEPNYEAHPAYHSKKKHTAQHVRRAAYWSMLIAPPAGLTYGHNAVWVWNIKAGPAENHGNVGTVLPWDSGIETDGTASMTIMRTFFESGPRDRLEPAQNLLAEQPGDRKPETFVTVGATPERDWIVAYTPAGAPITFRDGFLPKNGAVKWFDPRNGESTSATGARHTAFSPPDAQDWVLEIRH